MKFVEQTVNKKYEYKGKIINVRKDDVLLPNGSNAIREMVEHSGGSAIVCERDGKILMVKQFLMTVCPSLTTQWVVTIEEMVSQKKISLLKERTHACFTFANSVSRFNMC